MVAFILLTLLLLFVAVFALENHTPVTIRFLTRPVETSVAILTLSATTVGAVIAGLIGLGIRFQRWQRARHASATARATTPPSRPTP
jgi:uncharacterized integral membrane protein